MEYDEFLPPDFITYLDKLAVGCDKDWQKRLLDSDFRNDIAKRFETACSICKITPNKLLKGLDFKANDIRVTALESFFAELRSIAWLNNLGMVSIRPIPASRGFPLADIYCELGNNKYLVEVFCLSKFATYKWPNHRNPQNDFFKYFIDNVQNKRRQLDSSMGQNKCNRKIFVMVVNSPSLCALINRNKFAAILEKAHGILGYDDNFHLGIITGQVDLSGVCDDVVHPSIPTADDLGE